jgi:hypothetical protein
MTTLKITRLFYSNQEASQANQQETNNEEQVNQEAQAEQEKQAKIASLKQEIEILKKYIKDEREKANAKLNKGKTVSGQDADIEGKEEELRKLEAELRELQPEGEEENIYTIKKLREYVIRGALKESITGESSQIEFRESKKSLFEKIKGVPGEIMAKIGDLKTFVSVTRARGLFSKQKRDEADVAVGNRIEDRKAKASNVDQVLQQVLENLTDPSLEKFTVDEIRVKLSNVMMGVGREELQALAQDILNLSNMEKTQAESKFQEQMNDPMITEIRNEYRRSIGRKARVGWTGASIKSGVTFLAGATGGIAGIVGGTMAGGASGELSNRARRENVDKLNEIQFDNSIGDTALRNPMFVTLIDMLEDDTFDINTLTDEGKETVARLFSIVEKPNVNFITQKSKDLIRRFNVVSGKVDSLRRVATNEDEETANKMSTAKEFIDALDSNRTNLENRILKARGSDIFKGAFKGGAIASAGFAVKNFGGVAVDAVKDAWENTVGGYIPNIGSVPAIKSPSPKVTTMNPQGVLPKVVPPSAESTTGVSIPESIPKTPETVELNIKQYIDGDKGIELAKYFKEQGIKGNVGTPEQIQEMYNEGILTRKGDKVTLNLVKFAKKFPKL